MLMTRTLNRLTSSQVGAFHDQGFLVLEDAIAPADLDVLRASVDVLEAWAQHHQHPHFDIEKTSTADNLAVRKIQAIHHHGGAPWRALMTHPYTLEVFEDLLGPDLRFHHSKLMMKPPFEGSAKHWHQDLSEGFVAPAEVARLIEQGTDLTPERAPVVAIQYYLDDSSAANGCIEVVPGSHRRGLHTNPLARELFSRDEVVQAEVPAGGALLFHCLTYHFSAPNTSPHKRRGPVYEYFAPTDDVALLPRQQDYGLQVRTG